MRGGLAGAAKGAFFAALFYGAGTYADTVAKSSGSIAGKVARAASHAVIGCVQSASAGGSCVSGAASAGISALVPDFGSFERNLAARAATGAITSAVTGGNIGQGAVIAAFGYLYNDFSHKMFSPPSLPQEVVDFSAAFGDTISFGLTDIIRDVLDINGVVDKNSGAYDIGEWAGVGYGVMAGGTVGLRTAGQKAVGKEYSHWIPRRYLPKELKDSRTLFNGNYVSPGRHYKHDPFRYPSISQRSGGKWPTLIQQIDRVPNVYKGGIIGGGVMGASTSWE